MDSGKISSDFFSIKNAEQGDFSSPTDNIEWMMLFAIMMVLFLGLGYFCEFSAFQNLK